MIGFTLTALLGLAAPPVEHASAEDCAVIVAVLRTRAAWSADGPNTPLVMDGKQSDGSLYREDCDWKALGVGAPIPLGTDRARIGIDRPSYGPDGKTATTGVSFFAPRGRTAPAFMAVWTCSLGKTETTWEVIGCVQGQIN